MSAAVDNESDFNMSTLSINSNDSTQSEDWDRSLILNDEEGQKLSTTTPRNSVAFPAHLSEEVHSTPKAGGKGKRTLSELLRLHSEKGTDCTFTTEEAARLADVLGEWINTGSSPYEGEDDFFSRPHDDLSVPSKRTPADLGRPRGQSESSRPSSALGSTKNNS